MNILSAVSTHHDESVCVLKNNEIKYHLQLERYTRRKKNKYIKYIVNPFDTDEDGVFQGMYQNRVLEKLDPAVNKIINLNYSRLLIKLSSIIDKIDIFATSTVFQKRSLQQMDELNKLDKNIIYPIFESKKFDVDIDSIENSRYLFCSPPKKLNDFHLLQDKIYLIDHHQSHAAYALYTSNFEEADVFAYDGWGSNFQSAFVNANGDMFELGFLSKNPEVYTGFLWSNVSLFLFANNMKEGTMMGLSAYGKIDDKLLKLFYEFDSICKDYSSKIVYKTTVKENDSLQNVQKYWEEKLIHRQFYADNFLKLFKEPLDSDDEKLKANVCATLQHFTVETVVNALKKRKTSDNLCIAGGCGLNGYVNEELIKRKIYKKIHVPPAVADEGQSLGCCIHALHNLENKRILLKNKNKIMYLGEEVKISNKKINYDYEFMEDDSLINFLAVKISEGYVVGWFQGRSESGPRALGNRSILADPRNSKMKDHINFKIKQREWFRPFAPSILLEEYTKWFKSNNQEDAPYMTRILEYKKGKGKKVPATCHIDNTARVQTVTENINPRFYNLINEFYKLTKIPMVLNTSFNGKNEPIVETIDEAFKCFKKNNIDILVTGNYIYYRNNDKNVKPFIEES